MIYIKSPSEIQKIRIAGNYVAQLFEALPPLLIPGQNTLELDKFCHDWMVSHGLKSATLNYRGYPKSICTSINNVVCHGIPKKEDILQDGDIISIDIALIKNGYYADSCRTFLIGRPSLEAQLLVERTKQAMEYGISVLEKSHNLNSIGKTIESYANKFSYGVVKELGGHGIGRFFHEDPFIPHYYDPHLKTKLKPGMVFTIEPMINAGSYEIFVDKDDKWTVRTEDNSLSAQFEHTVLITETGVEILTLSL